MTNLTIVDHPLVQDKLTLMRRKETPSSDFRRLLHEISMLLAYEITRDLPMTTEQIETPMMEMDAPVLAGAPVALVSILRAGNGFLNGMLELIPSASVGFVGLQRNEETKEAEQYYYKIPSRIDERPLIVVDPMLATGNTSVAAIDLLKKSGAQDIRFLSLLAAPEGVETLQAAHPDVPIFTAALDECLNEDAYILPGLGDAGDRIYGTN